MFDESVKFKYSWRPYQKRVLDNSNKYLQDGKINIVAAPGSGKTVLGLELVRRIDKPVLILAPTVTIKNQWVDRFVSLFLNTNQVPEYISTNIYDLKKFNVVTYQALHYAYKKQMLKDEEIADTDDVEIEHEKSLDEGIVKEYNLVSELKKKQISTFVLDEAHHLKSQWWKSLTEVLNSMNDIKTVSLTATPPYDEEYTEFKKYIDLCGEIDETISVPELVADDNLCPHQDYIYFNMPTEEEVKYIREYSKKLNEQIEKIKQDNNFLEAIKNHKYIVSPYTYEEELLDNVEYYSSMLIYLNSRNIRISHDNLSILGANKKIPSLSLEWLEILLRNVLIMDRTNYANYEECISNIENELNKIGAIEKKTLSFKNNKALEKYFVNSIGKLDSISKIVDIESSNLGKNLRMVILTDYIRKEFSTSNEIEVNKLGIFPIFKKVRDTHPDIGVAILTGTMFVIPKSAKDNVYGLCQAHNVDTSKITYEELPIDENYLIIKMPDSMKNKVMSLISKLFASGIINIIIGTKSLLGEGWDEPSINTLVLASFVGSYMLSNQMRGRAIRVNDNPRKTANIWHLVCICDDIDASNVDISNADFNTLERRFKSFAGVGYKSNHITTGIERLGIHAPFNKEKITNINSAMEENSKKRDEMYDRWKDSINMTNLNSQKMLPKIEVEEQSNTMKKSWFIDSTVIIIAIIFAMILLGIVLNILKLKFFFVIIELILGIYLGIKISKIKRLSNSEKNMAELGKVVLNSLYRCKYITTGISRIRVVSRRSDLNKIEVYITGATEKESNIFNTALKEVLSKTINQRYIITRINKKLEEIGDYYNVPTLLGVKKEYAEIFKTYFEDKIGKCDLIYTRSAEGRKVLLKARMKSMDFKDKITNKEEFIYFK